MFGRPTGVARGGGRASPARGVILLASVCLLGLAGRVRAGAVASGDVKPPDPASWGTKTTAYIGYSAIGTLSITAGGWVYDDNAYLGYKANSTGMAAVTASAWRTFTDLVIGGGGSGTLFVSSGGQAVCDYGTVGQDPGSTGEVRVDGADSEWTCTYDVIIGDSGGGTLRVTGGGHADSGHDAVVGSEAGSMGAVFVDGEGSRWWSSSELTVGSQGTGTLEITGGGSVEDAYGYVGRYPGSSGEVRVEGEGSTWKTRQGFYVGAEGSGTLVIADRGRVESFTIGYPSYTTYVASEAGSRGHVTVDGGGSTWAVGGPLAIGGDGCGVLRITGGGAVTSQSGLLGNGSDSSGIAVDGPDSRWTCEGDLTLHGGTMDITAGGAVSNVNGNIASGAGDMAQVTVAGATSTWTNTGSLYVAPAGSGTLTIADGSVTVSGETVVSRLQGSAGTIHFENGTLTTGSLLCRPGDLTGTGTIHTGGLVSDLDLVFDAAHGPSQALRLRDHLGQDVTVNLRVSATGRLGAGFRGAGTMSISGERVIESSRGTIGYSAGSTGVVTVAGAGSRWTCASSMYVGLFGSGELHVTGGAAAEAAYAPVGYNPGATGQVIVDGAESTWSTDSHVYVGYEGAGELRIAQGGYVSNGDAYVGALAGSVGEVTVGGDGSRWWVHDELNVGWQGIGTLTVTGGGRVDSRGVAGIAAGEGTTGHVTVTGDGSTWAGHGPLYVGGFGSGRVDITEGALVGDNGAYVDGFGDPVSRVTVDGEGSRWYSPAPLIGWNGRGLVVITNGGTVTSELGGAIAVPAGSAGDVTVRGPGSTWSIQGRLSVGNSGAGTLHIADGGLVSAEDMRIDLDGDGDAFVTMASGGMLALLGDAAGSLAEFLDLITYGSDDIRYWDRGLTEWADLRGAVPGVDYTLTFQDGYTTLTVFPGPMSGDANMDGQVGIADLSAIADNYGRTAGSTVPEPAAALLLALGLPAALRRRRAARALTSCRG